MLPAVAVAFVVVVLVNCLPSLGSNVGGLLALTPVFGLMWLGLTGRRVRARDVAVLSAAALALLIVLATVDLVRPDADRTHLGRLVAKILHDGAGPLWEATVRTESSSMHLLLHSRWTVALSWSCSCRCCCASR